MKYPHLRPSGGGWCAEGEWLVLPIVLHLSRLLRYTVLLEFRSVKE